MTAATTRPRWRTAHPRWKTAAWYMLAGSQGLWLGFMGLTWWRLIGTLVVMAITGRLMWGLDR